MRPAWSRWKPLSGALIHGRLRPPARCRDHVDLPALVLVRVVEQRQPAIAVLEQSDHGRQALDRRLNLVRQVATGAGDRGADVDQVAQQLDHAPWAALDVAAVGEQLAR